MTIKEKLIDFYYDVIYDFAYSFVYSIKYIINELKDFILLFKKPETWSAIMYVAFAWAFYYKKFDLFKWILLIIFIVYFIRQRIDARYKFELKLKAFENNNINIVGREYEKYKKKCFFKKSEPLPIEEWKVLELQAMRKNNS